METPRGTAERNGFRLFACGLLLLGAACGGSSTAPSPPVAAAPTPEALAPCTVAAPPETGWNWSRVTFPGGPILSLAIDQEDGRTWIASSQGTSHVWVTNDAGVTWRSSLAGFVDFGGLRSGTAGIYAPISGTANGLNVSRDHGRSWTQILRPPADAGWIGGVLPSRVSPGLLIAGSERLIGGNGRPDSVYRSLDDGRTWTEVALDGGLRYLSFMHFAEDGSGAILAASSIGSPGAYFRSTDAGASWESVDGPFRNAALGLASDTVRRRVYVFGFAFVSVSEDGGRSWSRPLGAMTAPEALVVDERTGGVLASQGLPARRGVFYLPDGSSTFRAVGLDGSETNALAIDRCGSFVLAGGFSGLFSSPIPRNP